MLLNLQPCRYYAGKVPVTFREAKFLTKIMERNATRKNNHPGPIHTTTTSISKFMTKHKSHRMDALNKLYVTHITDLLSTGNAASDILNIGIEITHINISYNYEYVYIFWVHTDTDTNYSDAELENILSKASGELHNQLCQLKLMGIVPKIRFTKNKQYALSQEIEQRLKVIKAEGGYNSANYVCTNDSGPIAGLLPMKTNILGLDQAKIMSRIKRYMKRTSPTSNKADLLANEMSVCNVFDAQEFQEDQKAFANYLRQRKNVRGKSRQQRSERDQVLLLDEPENEEDYIGEVTFDESEDEFDEET